MARVFYWSVSPCMLGYFKVAAINDIENLPVCADYCDACFDACQDDSTCVVSWLEELHLFLICLIVVLLVQPVTSFMRCMAVVNNSAKCGPETAYCYSTDSNNYTASESQ